MTHVMIDLETMGNGHDASITQIGAVAFTEEVVLPGEFSADVRLASSAAAGLKIDPSTVTWWMEQDGAARAAWLQSQKQAWALSRALHELEKWLTPLKAEGIWSHGSTFDLPILNNAYRSFGNSPGWNFRDARDTRTLFWLCKLNSFDPWAEDAVEGEVKHKAVDDARRQTRAVIRALAHVRGNT